MNTIKLFFFNIYVYIILLLKGIGFLIKLSFMRFSNVPKGFMPLKIIITIVQIGLAISIGAIIFYGFILAGSMVGLLMSAGDSAERAMYEQTSIRRRRGPFM